MKKLKMYDECGRTQEHQCLSSVTDDICIRQNFLNNNKGIHGNDNFFPSLLHGSSQGKKLPDLFVPVVCRLFWTAVIPL